MGEALMFGGGRTVLFDPSFEKVSWASVIAACQSGRVPDTWKVGDQKPMLINGTEYMIDIIGINHDDYADGSGKAPLTFQLHDCYETIYLYESSGYLNLGWTGCTMRTTYLPQILAVMSSEIQSAIREVNKLTSGYGGGFGMTTTKDKLFLLSPMEVFGNMGYAYSTGEGTRYQYYAQGGSVLKQRENLNVRWWNRSPANEGYGYMAYACSVKDNGTSGYDNATIPIGVSFAFCF